MIDVDCPPTLKEIAAQDSEQSDTYSASDRYIRHMIIYGLFKLRMHEVYYLQSKHCVPFKAFVPCHWRFPFLPIVCFVVLTELVRSDGSSCPRSKEEMRLEVDQNQVRFHVIDRCFFIQKAILNILVVNVHGHQIDHVRMLWKNGSFHLFMRSGKPSYSNVVFLK